MVQTVRIEAVARERAGKGAARATRREGLVPGVIYGAKQGATLIALDPRVVMKEVSKGGWQSHFYEVAVQDGPTERSVMRDVQFDPVTDRPVHVDFQRIAAGARLRVRVPVVFLNEGISPGLKAGGVLNVVRREVEVMADTDNVPEHFEIDLAEAKIGDGLRWSAIKDNFGARPTIAGRDFMVASIAAPTKEAEAAPAAEGAAAAASPELSKAKGKAPAAGAAAAPAAGAAAKPAAPAKKK
jgi:large subunit ribosomal protein L25